MANVPATRSMFKQYYLGGKEDLNEWRKRFCDALDPTEVAGAEALGYSWTEWQRFKRSWPEFTRSILPDWLDEIEVRLRSAAIRAIINCSKGKAQDATSSAKWLAEGRWKEKKVGKPSKEEVTRQAKIAAGVQQEVDDEVSRVLGNC